MGILTKLTKLLVRFSSRPATADEVAAHVDSIYTAVRTARLGDLILSVPKQWDCKRLGPGRLLFVPSALGNGLTFQAIYSDAEQGTIGNTDLLTKQVKDRARQWSWAVVSTRTREINGTVEAVDIVAEAKNGVCHRFVNFVLGSDDSLIDAKADNATTLESTTPVIDAWVDSLRFR